MHTKKSNFLLFILGVTMVFSSTLQASSGKYIKIYNGGINDALSVLNQSLGNNHVLNQNPILLKGIIVYSNANNLTNTQIVKNTAIATKLGYSVRFYKIKGQDDVVYSLKHRLPDARSVAENLQNFHIVTTVSKINQEVKTIPLVGENILSKFKSYMTRIFKRKNEIITSLEHQVSQHLSQKQNYKILHLHKVACLQQKPTKIIKKIIVKKIIKYVKLNTRKFQIVNRVLTEKYLQVKNIKNVKNIPALNHYAKTHMSKSKVISNMKYVKSNIVNNYKKRIPLFTTFSQIYAYITRNGMISKDGALILNGKIFHEGNHISGKWYFAKALHTSGVVIVKEHNIDYHARIAKKQ